MDRIGFQDLITEQLAWWGTYQTAAGVWTQRSAGKQPAWLNYVTNYNRVKGNFAIPVTIRLVSTMKSELFGIAKFPFTLL